jgi:uncharacterized protein (TIGR02246 family)
MKSLMAAAALAATVAFAQSAQDKDTQGGQPPQDTTQTGQPPPDTAQPAQPTPDTAQPAQPTPDTAQPAQPTTPDTAAPAQPTPDTAQPAQPTPDTAQPAQPTPDTAQPAQGTSDTAATGQSAQNMEKCEPPKYTPEQIKAFREKQINSLKELTEKLNQGFANKDAHAVAQLFTEDGRLMNPRGEKASGREDVQKLIQSDMDGFLKNASLTVTNVDIKLLKPSVAIVDFDHVLTCRNESAKGSLPPNVHVSTVAVKKNGQWLFKEVRAASYPQEKPAA